MQGLARVGVIGSRLYVYSVLKLLCRWLICYLLLTSTFSNAPWCWLHTLSWLNGLQISLSFWGLVLFAIFPCLCWLYIFPFPGRSLPSFLVAFFVRIWFWFMLRTWCCMRASSPRVLDQESPQSAPGELARRLCFVPREWSHIFQCFVGLWCLLHVFLWLVGCMFSSW